ncbi:hypothetical protein KL938_004919 [Ogataea parapolymorpha]|nr:hypothetical protein KL938_004919 [Ogataea parapolymorpha]
MDLARIFQGNFSVFQLEPGSFNLSDGTVVDNAYPSIFFTNASDWNAMNKYLSSYQATIMSTVLPLTRDDFHDSVIVISFVLCTLTVGFWLLFLIQSIATEKRPLHLQLTTTLLAVFSTVILVRFTTLMREEFEGCFQDRLLVIDRLFNKLYYTVPVCILRAFTYVSWYWLCDRLVSEFRTRAARSGNKMYRCLVAAKVVNALFMVLVVVFTSLHYFLTTKNNYYIRYWVNVTILVFTSFVCVYIWVLVMMFWLLRVDRRFKFENLGLLVITFVCYWFNTGMQLMGSALVARDPKWMVQVNLFFEILSIHLLVDFISGLEKYNHKTESHNIVGRETIAIERKTSDMERRMHGSGIALELDGDSETISNSSDSGAEQSR